MKIAIVALNASPLIDSCESRRIGGLETFAWSLAQALAADASNSIMFVVRSRHQRSTTTQNQVQVSFVHEPLREVRQSVSQAMEIDPTVARFRIKRWNSNLLWQVPTLALRKLLFKPYSESRTIEKPLKDFAPELIAALGVNETSSQLCQIASIHQVPIVLWLQSNADLEPKLYETDSFQDEYGVSSLVAQSCMKLCRNIIFQSDAQITQFRSIEPVLLQHVEAPFQVTLIRNPVDTQRFYPDRHYSQRRGVLWIGRADRFHKRPLLALQIARLCPDIPFQMVLNPGEASIREQVKRELPFNVELIDFVLNEEMPARMRGARIFLSTGSPEFEGFPNVLLEAAASGTPIISIDDFDGFLVRSGAGNAHSGSIDQAADSLKQCYHSEPDWTRPSVQGARYVLDHHSLDTIASEFKILAKNIISAGH